MRDIMTTMELDEPLQAGRMNTKREGEVVASLRGIAKSIGGDEVLEEILGHEKVRASLSSLNKSDGLEAVTKLGDSLKNRLPELDPIADHAGYFLKILSRYTSYPKAASPQNNKREGEVVGSLRRIGRKNKSVGNETVEEILANEDVRSSLSSLTKSQGLEAVEKLGDSMTNRPKDLDPIADPAGYFMKILNRYSSSEGNNNVFNNPYHNRGTKKRQRDTDDDDDDTLSSGDGGSLESKLRLANRRVGRFKINFFKSEKMVSKLEAKVQELTSELEKTKKELAQHKN